MNRVIANSAFAAALLVMAMIVIAVATGVSQEPFEVVHSPADYAASILAGAQGFRAILFLDCLFIIAYTTALLLTVSAVEARNTGAPRLFLGVIAGGVIAIAVLDAFENTHMLALLRAAEAGVALDPGQIVWRETFSTLKFVVSYVTLFMLGIVFPRDYWGDRVLAVSLIYFQAPLGMLSHVAPPNAAVLLSLVRVLFFFAGMLLLGFGARRRMKTTS